MRKHILLILVMIFRLQGTTIYVTKAGNDMTGDGSSGNPYLTIQKCSDVIAASMSLNTCDVAVGTYSESVTLQTNAAGARTTYVVHTGDTVTIAGGAADKTVIIGGDNITLDGFMVTGGGNPANSSGSISINAKSGTILQNVHQTAGAFIGIFAYQCTDTQFLDLEVDHNENAGVYLNGECDNTLIQGGRYHHNGGTAQIIIYANGSPTIGTCDNSMEPVGCTAYFGVDDAALGIENTNTTIKDLEVDHATDPDCNVGSPDFDSCSGIWLWWARYTLIDNVHVHDVQSTGIQAESGVRYLVVQNSDLESADIQLNGSEVPMWVDETAYAIIQDNIIHDTSTRGGLITQSSRVIWRRNRMYEIPGDACIVLTPGGAIGVGHPIGATKNAVVHNTCYNVSGTDTSSTKGHVYSKDETNGNGLSISGCNDCVTDNVAKNNILAEGHGTKEWHEEEDGSGSLGPDWSMADFNLFYNSGRALSFIWGPDATCGGGTCTSYSYADYKTATGREAHSVNDDPAFTNPGSANFTLQVGSPAIDAGGWLTTITSATGSGTSITVADPRFFADGYSGLVTGDAIKTSAGQTATITAVNYSTGALTLDTSISWTMGDGIGYPYNGTAPDIGAIESSLTAAPISMIRRRR